MNANTNNTAAMQVPTLEGMTLRQYAAIKLKVPDSGADWLDEMITTSLRNDFSEMAMQAQMLDRKEMRYWSEEYSTKEMLEFASERAFEMADAMLVARKA